MNGDGADDLNITPTTGYLSVHYELDDTCIEGRGLAVMLTIQAEQETISSKNSARGRRESFNIKIKAQNVCIYLELICRIIFPSPNIRATS